MLVDDGTIYVVQLFVAVIFTMMAFIFPFRSGGKKIPHGQALSYIRAILFPFLATASWFVMAFFTVSINNCSATYNACYTSPTFQTATASIYTSQAGPLFWYYFGMGFVMLIIGIGMTVWLAFYIEIFDEDEQVRKGIFSPRTAPGMGH